MNAWHAAYKAARAEGKGDEQARNVANAARAAFANRPEREPVRSREFALKLLPLGHPVPVSKYLWREFLEVSTVTYRGHFLWVRQRQFHWGYNPDEQTPAWINSDLIAGYRDGSSRLCLLQLQADDWVIPAQKTALSAERLRRPQNKAVFEVCEPDKAPVRYIIEDACFSRL